MDYKDKIVWITGASSGIGEATALEFSKHGAKLILSARREDELKRVQKLCLENTSVCEVYPLDLTLPEQISATVDKIKKGFSRVDVLFSNGGISQRSLASETPVENDRKIMEINYFGGITLTKQVLPIMLEQNTGQIIVNSSITGKFGFPLRSAYAASKHALHGFYDSLRAELASTGISVTIVCPGRVVTNISYNALEKDGTKHGKMDEGQAEGISSEKCARQIVKAARNKKAEVLIGKKEVLMVHVKRFFPGLLRKIVTKVNPT